MCSYSFNLYDIRVSSSDVGLQVIYEQPSASSLHVLDAFTRLRINVTADSKVRYIRPLTQVRHQEHNQYGWLEYDHDVGMTQKVANIPVLKKISYADASFKLQTSLKI